MLKRLIKEQFPDLMRQGQSALALEAFKEAIRECWRLLDQEKIDSLIRSMTTRVNTVIAVEGGIHAFRDADRGAPVGSGERSAFYL